MSTYIPTLMYMYTHICVYTHVWLGFNPSYKQHAKAAITNSHSNPLTITWWGNKQLESMGMSNRILYSGDSSCPEITIIAAKPGKNSKMFASWILPILLIGLHTGQCNETVPMSQRNRRHSIGLPAGATWIHNDGELGPEDSITSDVFLHGLVP